MATAEDYKRMGVWAVMKDPQKNIDRRKCRREVPMEVLCFGMSRTGTQSMQEALQILGYPTYHYSSIFANVRDCDMWNEALDAKFRGIGRFGKADFDQLLGHVSATTDTPTVLFWQELMAYYPDAKIVLVERDIDKWCKSMGVLLGGILNPVGKYVLRFTDPYFHGRVVGTGMGWVEALLGSTDYETAMRNAPAAYRKHYDEVRKTVPKERMLEYELGQGWEPLCKFLGKPVPNVPFPHRNEANAIQASFGAFLAKAFMNSVRNIVLVGAVSFGLVMVARRLLG